MKTRIDEVVTVGKLRSATVFTAYCANIRVECKHRRLLAEQRDAAKLQVAVFTGVQISILPV